MAPSIDIYMTESIIVSVVIVSWNAKAYLMQCLSSLEENACNYSTEILVIDNASTDGSPEFVAENFPYIRLIRNPVNLGFSKANNIGIKNSRGKYVCLINSDVRILKDCIKNLVAFMETHPDIGLAGPRMLDANEKAGRSCRGFPTVWNMFCHAIGLDRIFPGIPFISNYTLPYWHHNTTRQVDILGGWFWIARRAALDEVGLLDENFFFYAEDMDWCKRFQLKGLGVMFLATAESIHYGGGSSKNAPVKYYIQQQRADYQYWRKHHSRFEIFAYYCICLLHHFVRFIGHGILLPFSELYEQRLSKAQRSGYCLLWLLRGT